MATPFLRQLKAVFQLGPKKAYRQLMSMGDIKPGNLIGKDDQGNEYYEDTKEELWVRSRWVIPADDSTFDPSMIPAEWHMWLHKIDDRPPTHPEINAKPYPWIQPMMANPTSTSSAFKTFSTVPPKIQAWVPHVTVREVEGNEEIKKIK